MSHLHVLVQGIQTRSKCIISTLHTRAMPNRASILGLALLLVTCCAWLLLTQAYDGSLNGLEQQLEPLRGHKSRRSDPLRKFKKSIGTESSDEKKPNVSEISYETKWFTQLVDHFTWTNEDTFKQRFLVNEQHWCGSNCPILFYCGSEHDIEHLANNTGWMWENAANLHAMLVFAEHRFYGKSTPYPIDFTKVSHHAKQTLGYLTSEQALADYATLIYEIKNTLYDAKYSPVIAIGGNYGGMLASWLRMKYSNTVAGALAASAPILQFPGQYECGQFSAIVTKNYENYSANCSRSISHSWAVIRAHVDDDPFVGLERLSSIFNTCKMLKDREDLKLLLDFLSDIWISMAMTDYAHESNFLARLPAYPVKHACAHLNSDPLLMSGQELIEKISQASQVFTNYTGTSSCLDLKQNSGPIGYLWDFQSCTEMVMPICFDGNNDMFEAKLFNLTRFSEECKRKWGVKTQVNKTRALYGDKNLAATSNIIYSSCSRDPWSAGCPQEGNEENSIHAIKIPNACQQEDLRASGPNDSTEVKKARQNELNIISDWIQKHYEHIKKFLANETLIWCEIS